MSLQIVLLVISILFFVSIIADKAGYRFGVPTLLLFLMVGMLFGSDGFGIQFGNMAIAEAIGSVSLCIILFSGGLDTKIVAIKPVAGRGAVLAIIGVILMAGITGVAVWWLLGMTYKSANIGILMALLVSTIMSSTDSASVFAILRSKNLHLRNNLRPLLELESGSNDPIAYMLTTTLIGIITSGTMPGIWTLIGQIILQLLIGTAVGVIFGKLIVWLINKMNIENTSLYPIAVLTSCIFIFSATYFMHGNSYLAVYLGGLVIGNSKFLHKRSTIGFFDGLSWLCQLLVFLTLGLLVNPHELIGVCVPGLIISFIIIFVTRPLSVYISLLPFRKMPFRDKTFVSWVGLRGAVPIIFAIQALSAGVPQAQFIFNIVFFCTLISLLVQGTSLPTVAKLLKVTEDPGLPDKLHNFEIDLPEEGKSEAVEIKVTPDILSHGKCLMEWALPENTLAIMVKRDKIFFVPTGKTVLRNNDILLIITDNKETLANVYRRLNINKD